jgi:predicted PurR-regulated permease PerM
MRNVGYDRARRPSLARSQTVFTVLFGAICVWAAVMFVSQTRVALTLVVTALMIAIALNHGVALLGRLGLPRPLGIVIVILVGLGLLVGLGFMIVPPAVNQGKALVVRLPEILKAGRDTRIFHALDDRLHIAKRLQAFEHELPHMMQETAAPLLSVLGGVVSGLAAVVTVAVLAIFMLTFGRSLIDALVGEALPARRGLYVDVMDKTYRSIGGYLLGLGVICAANATLTTTFLAIVWVPFFLPLGLVSGLSSLVPYAGPAVVGTTVTVIALATKGTGTGIACAIYFLAYGQLEGQVLAPLIFRRTVHVNPLVVVLSILFFGELGGLLGAVLAVPAAATIQIVVREILQVRRDRLHLEPTPLNSPDGAAEAAGKADEPD